MTTFRKSLRRRFLFSFAGLMAALALLSLVLTLGSLYFYYRSTVEMRTREVGRRFEVALQHAEETLLFRTRILADIARIQAMGLEAKAVREIQVHTLRWLKKDGLQLVGIGSRDRWKDQAEEAEAIRRAFTGIPVVDLTASEEGFPMLLAAVPREATGGVADVIAASLPLDSQTLAGLALRAGGEISLYSDRGRLLASTLSRSSAGAREVVPSTPAGTVASVSIGGEPFAYRTFPLTVGQKQRGKYAVLWPVGELRRLTIRLGLWQLAGIVICFVVFYFLYRTIIARTTQDVEFLTDWARAFTPADPKPPPSLPRADEVGILSRVFAGLVTNLKVALGEVERKNRALALANSTLEDKVREKTREVDEQRRLLDTVLSGMRPAVFLLEANAAVVYANPAAQQIFGDVLGHTCDSLWGPDVCACGAGRSVEAEVTSEDRTYLVTYTPLPDAEGAVVVAQDVTERRTLERQLQQSQKLESVGRLAGGVAHDFNNVLGSILPCVEILRRRVSEPKALEYLDTIEAAAMRASAIVRQLLTFSRSGDFRPAPTDLNHAVEGAIQLLRPGLKGIQLVWHPKEGLPPVRGDETQIQQAVLNLALNAIDAMEHKGTLTIEARPAERAEAVLLAVEDTGTGIPPDMVDKVFDPFFTTKQPGKGTGLGLSIVYGVVERHGGRIRVVPALGRGARFEIELPIWKPTPAPGQPEEPRASRGTLLVVDDDALLLRSLSDALRELGFHVVGASGGAEAVRIVEEKNVPLDVAVLDVRMPEMDGVELAEMLRRLAPDLPVVFMTAFPGDRADDIARLSRQAPLLKPFSPQRLAEGLRSLVPERQS